MSVHITKGAQENAIAAALLVKHLGKLLISTGVVTNTEAARVVRAAEAEAASLGPDSGPAIAEVIRETGQEWKASE
ncbi:hypothetical protein ABIE45_000944 [Methylobacterium sp. OAE515]|uniref:hypothetical protein n=1 Tax=Methylobacterium sp. OAE515 TaxID=2817895 RepID=UPI00178B6B4E